MVADPQARRMTLAEYWQLEETSDLRHEYIDGDVYSLAGGTAAHTQIAINAIVEFRLALQSGPCRVFNSDMRVKLNDNRYVFPDVTVSCDIADARDDVTILQSPRLEPMIVEKSSPVIRKRAASRNMPSLLRAGKLSKSIDVRIMESGLASVI